MEKTLKGKYHELSDNFIQLKVLSKVSVPDSHLNIPTFADKLCTIGLFPLKATGIEILQLNIGKQCNQTCSHCHVDAGPDRKEVMTQATMQQCLAAVALLPDLKTIDITGGAPEMNPNFRPLVEQINALGKHCIDRCNLTILTANRKFADLPQFFARHSTEIIASLPHYAALRTDGQRGKGVFEASIKGLQMLNAVGYGYAGTGLLLNLVYNPSGTFLPIAQAALEADFKQQLKQKYNIVFNNLYTITNMPISRFLANLIESGRYETYMNTLLQAFNPAAAAGVMCRNTLSVSWDGFLYDCDFNQMLGLAINNQNHEPLHISNFKPTDLQYRNITVANHCYGCTAGSGSSCGGEIAGK